MARKAKSLKELLALQPPNIQYIVQPQLLSRSGSLFIYGDAETLKSWIVLELAFAITGGNPWLETYPTVKGKCLLVQTEQPEMIYRARALKITESMNGTAPLDNLFILSEVALPLDSPIGIGTLRLDIQEIKPDIVILDNLFESVTSVSDEVGIKKFIRGMGMAQKEGAAVVVVHHTRKQSNEGPRRLEDMAGMSDLNRWADTVIRVTATEYTSGGRPLIVRLDLEKVKNSEEDIRGVVIKFDRSTARFNIDI